MIVGLGPVRIAVAAASCVVMAHDATAQSLCADFDRVVPLARSRFWSIRDEAHRGELKTRVTENLPGASDCWYHDASRSYWCTWRITPAARRDEVRRLASAIGRCYGVRPAYRDDDVDETIAFIDLRGFVSIHVNGAGETVTLSIGATFSMPEPYPQAP
jgi:hypothetical protein